MLMPAAESPFYNNTSQRFEPINLSLADSYQGSLCGIDENHIFLESYNWLDKTLDLTIVEGSKTASFSLDSEKLVYIDSRQAFVFSSFPKSKVIRYEIENLENLISDTVFVFDKDVKFEAQTDCDNSTAYFSNDSDTYIFDKTSKKVISTGYPDSYTILRYLPDFKLTMFRTMEGVLLKRNSNSAQTSYKIDLNKDYEAYRCDSSIFLIDKKNVMNAEAVVSSPTPIFSFTRDSMTSSTLPPGVKKFTALGSNIAYLAGSVLFFNNEQITTTELLLDIQALKLIPYRGDTLVFAAFRNGIIAYDRHGVNLNYPIDLSNLISNRNSLNIFIRKDELFLSGEFTTNKYALKQNPAYLLNVILDKWLTLGLLTLAIFAVYYFFAKYKRSQREVKELTSELQGGIFFTVDQNGNVIRANQNAQDILELRGVSSYNINRLEGKENLSELYELAIRVSDEKRDFTKKVHINNALQNSEYMFQVNSIHGTFGAYRGAVFFGTDITEELERKRLRNWAQLAHDMQTNLSVIKLNTEQLQILAEGANLKRLDKIKHQTDILLKRVRDIVTIGRSGNTHLQETRVKEIFDELEVELTNADYEIDFQFLAQDFTAVIDRKKVARALRNAIENGIKAIKLKGNSNGLITVEARKDARKFYLTVEDNGKGMEDAVKERMLTPYFTTGAASGGSGIGTMIMSNVVEIHGGEICIESKLNKGTKITFVLPLKNKKRIEVS